MYNNSWGYFVPAGARDPGTAFLSGSEPTTGSTGQTSTPNMFPTKSGQPHLQINPLSPLNFELHYLVISRQS